MDITKEDISQAIKGYKFASDYLPTDMVINPREFKVGMNLVVDAYVDEAMTFYKHNPIVTDNNNPIFIQDEKMEEAIRQVIKNTAEEITLQIDNILELVKRDGTYYKR